MNEPEPSCGNCRFWKHGCDGAGILPTAPENTFVGRCHRHAPIENTNGVWIGRWPTTNRDEWCGDWQGNTQYIKDRTEASGEEFVKHLENIRRRTQEPPAEKAQQRPTNSWREAVQEKINELERIASWASITDFKRVRDFCRMVQTDLKAELDSERCRE